MPAFAYVLEARGEIVLIFKCLACGKEGRNKADLESEVSDNYDKILALGQKNQLS